MIESFPLSLSRQCAPYFRQGKLLCACSIDAVKIDRYPWEWEGKGAGRDGTESGPRSKVPIHTVKVLQVIKRRYLRSHNYTENPFSSIKMTAENNDYHSIFVRYASRKSRKGLFCFDLDKSDEKSTVFCILYRG